MTESIALTERQAQRLLERWLLAAGAKEAAAAAVAAANAATARYQEEIATVADVPDGSSVEVDFKARTLTIAPGTA